MRNNIKIFAVAALFAFMGIVGVFSASAQTIFNYTVNETKCAVGLEQVSLFADGHSINPARSAYNYSSAGSKIVDYGSTKVYVLDSDGVPTDITTECIIAGGENGIVETDLVNGTKLKALAFKLKAVPEKYYGKTIRVAVNFVRGATPAFIENFDFDVVGAVSTIDASSAHVFDSSYSDFTDYLCEGDPISVEIANVEYPFGDEESYHHNKYFAKYSWRLSELDYFSTEEISNRGEVATDSKTYSSSTLSTGSKSRLWALMPFTTLYFTDASGAQVCPSIQMTPQYNFYYEAPVKTKVTLNSQAVSSLKVCDGDDVEVAFEFFKNGTGSGYEYYEVWTGLYLVEGASETLVWENNYLDNFQDFSYTLEGLTVKSKKNTTYNYRLKVKDVTNQYADNNPEACEGQTVDFSVVVLEKDATVDLTAEGKHCENDDVVVTMQSVTTQGVVADYTYQLRRKIQGELDETAIDIPTSDGGNKNSFSVTDSHVEKGDYTYIMYIKNQNGCEYKAGEVDVHVAEAPVLSAKDYEIKICKNDEAIIDLKVDNTSSQPSGSTYRYNWISGITDIDDSEGATFSKTISPKPLTTTSYKVSVTNEKTTCTSEPIVVKVVVNQLPDIDKINGPDNACYNSEVTLSPVLVSAYAKAEPITYTWTRKDGATVVETKDGDTYTYILDKEYDVTVSAKDNNGCSSEFTQTKTVAINPLPVFAPSADPACSGYEWSLEMNNGDSRVLTYSFSSTTPGAPSISTTTSNSFTVTSPSGIAAKTTYVYKVTAKDEIGCEDEKELILVVNPLPVISSLKASKNDQCLGTPVTLTVKANSKVSPKTLTYKWYDGTTELPGTTASIEVNPAVAGTHTYKVEVTDVNGCPVSQTIDVNFYEITTVEVVTDDDEICVGESTLLKAKLGTGANAADYSFKWSHGAVTQDVTVSPTATTPYSVEIKQILTGCTVSSVERVIYVNQLPEFTIKTVPAEVCEGEVTEVIMTMLPKAGTPVPSDYVWVSGGSASDFVATGNPNEYKASMAWSTSTTYTYNAVTDKTCQSKDPASVTIKVNPLPATPTATASPAEICMGDNVKQVTLAVSSPDAALKYFWFSDAACTVALNDGNAANSIKLPIAETSALVANKTYYVKAVNKTTNCESAVVGQVTLVVNNIPTVTITGDDKICEGESITLTANPVAGSGGTFAANAYVWYANDVVISGKTAQTLTVNPTADTKYSVKVKESTGCETAVADHNVEIQKRPVFTITFDPAFVCEGVSTTVTMTMTPEEPVASYTLASGPADFSMVSPGVYEATKIWSANTDYCYNAVAVNGCPTLAPACGTLEVSAKPETPVLSFDRPTVCNGDADPVNVTITNFKSGLKYTVTDGVNIIVEDHESNTFQITSVPTVETTYHVISKSGSECQSDEGTYTLHIAELPSVTITGDNAICEGSNVTLTANVTRGAGSTSTLAYEWAVSSDPSVVISTDAAPTFNPTADTEYIVTVSETDAATCSASTTYTVNVQKLPVITANADKAEICEGTNTTVTLTAVPDASSVAIASYEWFDASNASVGTGESLPLTESSWVAGTYNYTVKATSAESNSCESAPAAVSFTVNPQPVKPIVSLDKVTICQLASGTQAVVATVTNVQTGYIYTWYNSADVEHGSGASITLNVDDTAAGVQHYYVVATDKNFSTDCVSEKTDVDVEVIALPAAPVVAPVATEYCLNDASHATVLTLDENSALTYEWFQYVDGVSDISVSTASSFTTPDHLDATTSYYVVATNAYNCESEKSALAQITIVNNPVLSTVDAASIMVCPGLPSTRAITVTSANGEDLIFEWYIDGIAVDPSTVVSSATESTYTFASMAQTGTFNVNVKAWINNSGVKGCQADDLNFTLEIKDFENLDFTVNDVAYSEGITFNICQGADAKFVFSNLNGVSYKILDKNSVEVLNSSDATNSFVVADDDEYTLIKYTGECTSPIEQHFKIAARKQVLFDLVVPTDACVASDILLEAVNFDFQGNDAAMVSYQWYLDDVAIAGATAQSYAITGVTDATAGTYKLVATSDYGCETSHAAAIAVHGLPTIDWVADKTADILCLNGEERLFTIESTNGHTIADALWDIDNLHFGVVDTDPQISASAVSPDQADGDIITIKVYVVDENGCQTSLVKDVKVVAIPAITSITDQDGNVDAFHLCEGNDVTLTVNSTPASGDFTYVFYKEGVVISDWTSNSASKTLTAVTADLAGNYTVEIYDNISKCTSAEYAFTIDFPLPTADMTINPVSKLVIEGSPVEVTVTPGYTTYKFFLNGVEQTTGIVDNVFTYNAAETATVSAEVYNEYGCYITLQDVVTVLEGIADRKVEITADTQNEDKTEAMYCSTNRSTGATISVVEPQIGITYVLTCIENGAQVGAPIEALPGVNVKWNTIQTLDESTATQVKTDNAYKVTAYHASLPDQTTDMIQQVALSEIYGGVSETITPNGLGTDCTGETFKITDALVGYEYSLYLNGTAYGSSVVATSDFVELPGIIAFTGKYEIHRSYPLFPVCGEQVISTYEIPEVDVTKVTIFADDRLAIGGELVGFYCKSDDKKGVNITVENSVLDQEYFIYYQTAIDQVPVKVSAAILGNGADLMIGNTADINGDGFYSLGYDVHGCIQLVSKNILEVVGYSAPDKADFTVTAPEYFCEDDLAEIEITGALEDFYNYRLIRTAPSYSVSDVVLTGTTPGKFEVPVGGTYQIEVVNKVLEQMNLTCANTMLDAFVITRLDKPAPVSASFDKDDFCLDMSDQAFAVLTLSNLAPDAYYTLFDESDAVVSDKLGNAIENINDALGNGVKKFELSLTAGEHNYTVKSYRQAGGVICNMVDVATVSVKVRPRPGVGAEVISVNSAPAAKAEDECYGVDIEIANSRADMLYTLHSKIDDAVFVDGGFGSEAPKSSVQGNGDVVKFINIAVDGDFYVTVNYVDGPVDCEDKVDDVTINEGFLEIVSPSLTRPEICIGDGGTQVQLNKWQPETVAFYELRDASGKVVATSDDAEKVVGGTLTFNREFTSSTQLKLYAYKMVKVDGIYQPTCPILMGSLSFVAHNLPKSFEFSGRNIYCGDKSDIQLILPESEPNVEYTLYVKNSIGDWTEYYDEGGNKVSVMGRDDLGEVYFPRTSSTDQRFLDVNRYTVFAKNIVTGCTSSMKNEVEVLKRENLNSDPVLPKHEYKSCQGEAEKVVIPASNTQKYVTYYFYHSSDATELASLEAGVTPAMLAEIAEDQDKADDLVIRKYTGNDLSFAPSTIGDYVILASYDEYACPVFVDKFTYSIYNVDKYQLDAIAHCGGRVEYVLNGSQPGVLYTPYVNGVERAADAFMGDNDPKSFELDITDLAPETVVTVKALLGTCEIEMGGVVYPYTKTIPTINVIDVTYDDHMCEAGVYTYKSENNKFQPGITYYFMINGENPKLGDSPIVMRKANADGVIEARFPAGNYTVYATYEDEVECFEKMNGSFVITQDIVGIYNFDVDATCGIITLTNPYPGYSYSLTPNTVDAEVSAISGKTNSWSVSGKGSVVFSLVVADPGCPTDASVTIDFDKMSVPEGKLNLFVNENLIPADNAAFCAQLPVRFRADVDNVKATSYTVSLFEVVTPEPVEGATDPVEPVLTHIGDSISSTPSLNLNLSKLAAGNYRARLFIENECDRSFKIDSLDFAITSVPVLNVDTVVAICGNYPTMTFESDKYTAGYTYYFANEKETVASAVADKDNKISVVLPEGVFTVSADSKYDCLTDMKGNVVVKKYEFTDVPVVTYDCNSVGAAKITVPAAFADREYTLSDDKGNVIDPTSENTWKLVGSGVAKYTLHMAADMCDNDYEINVNFDSTPNPSGSFEFYVEGTKVDKNSVPEICSSSSVTIVSTVNGLDKISSYIYDFFKIEKNDDTQTLTAYGQSQSTGSNVFMPYLAEYDQDQLYRVMMSVRSGDCGPYKIDSLDFKIKGSSAMANRFLPDDKHIKNHNEINCQIQGHTLEMHGEYCEGDSAVNLYFSNPKPGNIYRLYQRVTEQLDSTHYYETVELLDMQEIPDYSGLVPGAKPQLMDKLWFTGWGANGKAEPYGATGTIEGTRYFVAVEESDGCVITTPDVIIYENPLPIDTVKSSPTYNEVFYALLDENGTPNFDVKSNDYGIVDAGFVILSNPQPGIFYELRHVDSPLGSDYLVSHVVCDSTTTSRGWVSFGKVESSDEAIAEGWGPGIYEVIAINPATGCDVSVGSVEFIDEELVAYNVYLFMNKKQNTVSQILYPAEEKFGNHRYIDWSRKVDVVWAPALVTDTITGEQFINNNAEDYEPRSGYSIFEKKSNIHFQLVQAMKDTVTYHDVNLNEYEYANAVAKDPDHTFKELTTRLEKYFLYNVWTDTITGELMKDSVSTGDILITYENGREKSRQYINTADENTKPTNDLGAIIETYKYWQTVYDTIQVIDYSKKYGDYGFDPDYDAINTPQLVDESKSGLFRYTKMPSFFGKVELTYRIYNDLLPNVRFSNNAQIVILCGNNLMPDGNSVFLVPNAFSPNDDGLNDQFEILLPHNYENSQVILEVFNRWGTRVYKSSGIRYGIDCPFWDGTSTTSNMVTVGEKLPSGTYYYVLTIKVNNPSTGETEDLDLKGFVELRR